MAKTKSIATAVDMAWLMRHINGESMSKLAKDLNKDQDTIKRHLAKAAETLVEQAQVHMMQEVFPLAAELFREAIKLQISRAKEGKDPDMSVAERVMKGMAILDRVPAQSIGEGKLPEVSEVETLTGFIATRPAPRRIQDVPQPKQLPIIEVTSERSGQREETENQTEPDGEGGRDGFQDGTEG